MSDNSKDEKECLAQLRQWVNANSHIPNITDTLLRIFLICRNYNVDLTKTTIESYVKIVTDMPELFSNYDPTDEEMMETMTHLYFTVLPQKDTEGRVIGVFKFSDKDPSIMNLLSVLKYVCIAAFSAALENKCLNGFVIVLDSGPIRFGHILKLRIRPIMKMLTFLQEAVPINIKKVHVINTSFFTSIILKTVRPFIGKELSEKLVFHDTDLSKLFEVIPKIILPRDYGGSSLSMEELGKQHGINLVKNRDLVLQADILRLKEQEE